MFLVHNYDPITKEYKGSQTLPFIPMHSTMEQPPPLANDLLVVFENGSWVVKPRPVIYAITNVQVEAAMPSAYGVYWVPRARAWRLTADIGLPQMYNGASLMVIIERIRRDDNNNVIVIDDSRFIATVAYDEDRETSVLTLIGAFENYGNYRIDATRLNIGLENANMPFRLSFNTVEFDSYAPTPVFVPDNT